MAEEVIITLKVDKQKADKSLEGIEKSTDSAKKSTQQLNKESKKTPKLLKGIGNGFKFIGTAMKAAGIGLVIGLFVKLTEVLSKNQKVVDAVNSVMTAIEIVISDVVTAVQDAYTAVSQTGNGFEALGKVIKGLMTIALTPLKLSFYSVNGALLAAQLAWEESFFGDGDPETIKSLNEKLEENKQNIIEVGTEAVKAGKDVVTNFGEAVGSIGEMVSKTADGIKEISIEASKAEADRLVELRRNIQIQEALLEGLQLKYQEQAEQLRQIRDNEEASIEDRIKANKELGQLLIDQAEEEKQIAQQKVSLLQQEIEAGDQSAATAAELIRANNKIAEINERITSQKSEQLVNEKSLRKEKEENLKQIELIGKTEREEAAVSARQKRDLQRKLIEKTIEDDKELKEALIANEAEYNDTIEKLEEEKAEAIKDIQDKFLPEDERGLTEAQKFELERERKREQFEKELEDLKESEKEKADLRDKFRNYEEEQKKEFEENQAQITKDTKNREIQIYLQSAAAISSILAESSAAAKGFAAAEAAFSTYVAIDKTLSAFSGVPVPGYAIAQAIATGIFGLAQVNSILNTSEDGSNVNGNIQGGSRGTTNNATQGPRFDIAGDSSRVRDAQEEVNKEPTKAYVVSKEVTSQQELDRNKQTNSRFI